MLLAFLVPLVLISGLRSIGIDRDSLNYASILDIPFEKNSFFVNEPFLLLLIYINKTFFFGEPQTFFFIFALLGVSLKLYAIRGLASYPLLSYITYILLYFILHEMTQIRVGIASAIFLLAIPDIENRNLKNYLIKTILASLFHYSAIIMLIVYFVQPKILNRHIYAVLPIVGVILATLSSYTLPLVTYLIDLLPEAIGYKLNLYIILLENDVQSEIKIFNPYYLSLLAIYFILIYKYKLIKSDYNIVLIKILGLSLFLYFALSIVPVFAFRLSEFFGVVLIILVPNLLFIFKDKLISSIIIGAWMIAYFFFIMIGKNLLI